MITRGICKTLLTAAIVLAGTALVAAREGQAATDLQTLERSIGSSAAETQINRPKATCVCLGEDDFRGAGGMLVRGSRFIKGGPTVFDIDVRVVEVNCVLLGFDPDDGGQVPIAKLCPVRDPAAMTFVHLHPLTD